MWSFLGDEFVKLFLRPFVYGSHLCSCAYAWFDNGYNFASVYEKRFGPSHLPRDAEIASCPRCGRGGGGSFSGFCVVSCLRGGGRGKFSAGVRRQVGSLPGRQPGTGTRNVRGGAVTPSLHPEVPDTRFASPGRGLGIWQSMVWTKVCDTARSGDLGAEG